MNAYWEGACVYMLIMEFFQKKKKKPRNEENVSNLGKN